LDLDPLGLIGSGSLIICCRSGNGDVVVERLREQGTEATVIGKVLGPGQGIEAVSQGQSAAWPCFKADEITRLFR
jgi:hydrogenase maturation factor